MGDLLLSNARLLDGRGGILERATVRLSAGRVAEVLPGVAAKKGWKGLEVVDLSGKTLMPALVDAHVHLSSYPTLPPPLRGEEPRTACPTLLRARQLRQRPRFDGRAHGARRRQRRTTTRCTSGRPCATGCAPVRAS